MMPLRKVYTAMIVNLPRFRKRDPYYYRDWSRWFAWYPVRLDEYSVAWLQLVERKDSEPLNDGIVWQYRRGSP